MPHRTIALSSRSQYRCRRWQWAQITRTESDGNRFSLETKIHHAVTAHWRWPLLSVCRGRAKGEGKWRKGWGGCRCLRRSNPCNDVQMAMVMTMTNANSTCIVNEPLPLISHQQKPPPWIISLYLYTEAQSLYECKTKLNNLLLHTNINNNMNNIYIITNIQLY